MLLRKISLHTVLPTLAVMMMLIAQLSMAWMTRINVNAETGQTIVICSINGINTITLDDNGAPIDNDGRQQSKTQNCPFCFSGSATIAAPDHPFALYITSSPLPLLSDHMKYNISDLYKGKPQNPRAPPVFS